MSNLDEAPSAIAQHMRARGKPDDHIRDTLRAWGLDEAAIDGIIANLAEPPAPTSSADDYPHSHAVALAAQMRNDGAADDLIRCALRTCALSEKEIDQILAAAPPRGKPVSHVKPPAFRPFGDWVDRIAGFGI